MNIYDLTVTYRDLITYYSRLPHERYQTAKPVHLPGFIRHRWESF